MLFEPTIDRLPVRRDNVGRFSLAPARSRKGGGLSKPRLLKIAFAIFAFCVVPAIASPADNIFTSLVSFDVTNGSNPYYASLIQGTDGSLYGTTAYGGASEQNCYGDTCGTIFKITPAGTLTTLHQFQFTDGGYPEAGLLQTTNGNFYGTAAVGGSSGYGTIFKITPAGRLTTVYEFQNSTDGGNPLGALVQAGNGILYGTTSYGGGNPCACGTVFKVTSAGILTTLHAFVGGGTEGNYPEAGLVQGTDGNFYGTTAYGGANGYGTIFKITPAGALTTLHNFDSTDGANPWAGLVQGADGNLYGTTTYGGTSGSGCTGFGCGTVFKITLTGTLTTLHNFDGTDGGLPTGGLVQATHGTFYGMAGGGGANNGGTIFKITTAGTLTTLHNFDVTDGANPMGGLAQATNGTFYGTTSGGGSDNDGTVFSLSVGLLVGANAALGEQVDYFGDGKADFTVWRPSTGTFYSLDSSNRELTKHWGVSTDIPVIGDFDGDGKTDFAVWRPSTGTWYIIQSSNGKEITRAWGAPGDIPVPGDYDGDGKTDYAVWRPSDGTWYILQSSNGETVTKAWGNEGDIPVPGDYDGDGKTDFAVWRPSNGTFYVIQSGNGQEVTRVWGEEGDIPVPGDYDGDGKTDYAIFRPSDGTWFVIYSSNGEIVTKAWGTKGDVPAARDYDGDGKTDYAVWRPSDGTWFVVYSSNGETVRKAWGISTDIPMNKPVGQ
jgi:uncharacterized repeat protein (TIGR03803 family)